MRSALAPTPILIDEPTLTDLAAAGHRWKEGQAGLVRYRWLLPPTWVLAAELPATPAGGITPLCGGGERGGGVTAVLGYLRGNDVPPDRLVARGAGPGVALSSFRSRAGAVAERIETREGKIVVTMVHAFVAGGDAYRFFIAAIGPADRPEVLPALRTMGVALSLADDLDAFRRGPLHA
jgi:hypothetical protein